MAAKKTTKKSSTKLKASKKKSLNKWVLLAGVVAVAIVGIVVVRYSSAHSGHVWSVRSSAVGNWQGSIIQKSSGSVFWKSQSSKGGISFTAPWGATYCFEGSYDVSNARMRVGFYDSQGMPNSTSYILNSGGQKQYRICKYLSTGQEYGFIVERGPVIFNRVVQQ